MHEYAGGNLALRRAVAEMNSARPHAPVRSDSSARRRRTARRRRRDLAALRRALATALRATAARLDPPCVTPQSVARVGGGAG
ncbi:hypothetical protein [Promicromonospora iranensis]|uniref:Uncharacterized protein n=1 Tax=Promicromonospora iranensis TaxID=1105144 RepID=A0ABU2CH02_9MICO|nr:hypothetical protein [Promicromonospora iranensis]MDR7380611.1 hypothetical protein [Promicromonospora iranensis]